MKYYIKYYIYNTLNSTFIIIIQGVILFIQESKNVEYKGSTLAVELFVQRFLYLMCSASFIVISNSFSFLCP